MCCLIFVVAKAYVGGIMFLLVANERDRETAREQMDGTILCLIPDGFGSGKGE